MRHGLKNSDEQDGSLRGYSSTWAHGSSLSLMLAMNTQWTEGLHAVWHLDTMQVYREKESDLAAGWSKLGLSRSKTEPVLTACVPSS